MLPRLICRVTRPDEEAAPGTPVASSIPTLGHRAVAIDEYRTVAVECPNIETINTCFVDISAAEASVYGFDVRAFHRN
eukprot:gene43196-58509_t